MAGRKVLDDLRRSRTNHAVEILKGGVLIKEDGPPKSCVFFRLLLQEIKLLLQESLLKVKRKPAGQQSTKHNSASTRNTT